MRDCGGKPAQETACIVFSTIGASASWTRTVMRASRCSVLRARTSL